MIKSHIFHICTKQSWQEQSNAKDYIHDSLESEKFIHCSHKEQLGGVLNRYFSELDDLLLLKIDSNKVAALIKSEIAPDGDYFPHIYGPLNKDAIIEIQEIDKSRWT